MGCGGMLGESKGGKKRGVTKLLFVLLLFC